jgi:hypothetical protein
MVLLALLLALVLYLWVLLQLHMVLQVLRGV